jgi:hypothetical protein
MQQLHRAIGHLQNLAICTDACKGVENAVKKFFLKLSKGSALGI